MLPRPLLRGLAGGVVQLRRCEPRRLASSGGDGRSIKGSAAASTAAKPAADPPEKARAKKGDKSMAKAGPRKDFAPADFRDAFPEFLPQPHWPWRNPVVETLERRDMLHRRTQLDIPEFYVGSIVAVTMSDRFVAGQKNRFLGICISRSRTGLRHNFVLRNVVDDMGVQIMYELYNPLIQKIEVIRLERRLDADLSYLRDAEPEFSTFPQDLHPTPHPPGAPIPVNTTQVRLRPPPWKVTWQRYDLGGVDKAHLWSMLTPHYKWKYPRASERTKAEEEETFDLATLYRQQATREDEEQIAKDMADFEEKVEWRNGKPRPLFRHRDRPN